MEQAKHLMIRFALILLMSLALSSEAIAAVKWNNSGKATCKETENKSIKLHLFQHAIQQIV